MQPKWTKQYELLLKWEEKQEASYDFSICVYLRFACICVYFKLVHSLVWNKE